MAVRKQSATPAISLSGVVLEGHKGCAVEVPAAVVKAWAAKPVVLKPGRRAIAATARAKGVSFDSHVVARSGRFWLLLDDATLSDLALEPGAQLRFTVAYSPPPRLAANRTATRR